MPVEQRPVGPAARARIAEIVRCMADGRVYARPTSQVVTVQSRHGEWAMTTSPSRHSMLNGRSWGTRWNFMTMTTYGEENIRVWVGTEGDWRDTVRDTILAELASRGYERREGDEGMNYGFARYRRQQSGWVRRDVSSPLGGLRMSSSMRQKVHDWDLKQGCRVSRMFFSTKRVEGGGYERALIDPLPAQYLTIREDGTISYLPKGRYENAESPWRPDGRQSGRPARVIRSLFTADALAALTDKDWEAFASRIKGAAEADKVNIRLVHGDDIRYWYDGDRYQSGSGDLDNSCMRYDECQSYFGIYTDNPNQCGLLIATNARNRLVGRTLIWTTSNDEQVHDRVYGSEASRAALLDWCTDNGIRQVAYSDIVQLENPWHEQYPYMDNMYYIDPDGCIGKSDNRTNVISFGSTSGGTDLSNGPLYCDECEEFIGWHGTATTCSSCRRAVEIRRREERRQALITNPPEIMTYGEYTRLPSGLTEMRNIDGERVLYIRDWSGPGGSEVVYARYAYYPERFSSGGDPVLFELMPVAVAAS